ncbi:MAG: TetR/AcrR family transcriptional regulator [Syntrophales bacterium]|nr:TetR/AcrR family transcriptional regulator [Syntrophales bacterium]
MGIEARRKRVKEIRQQTILKAARKLFFEKGFKNVTVESIAKKADISKGAVYLHFESKEEIYAQILLNDVDRHYKQMSELLKTDRNASDIILRLGQRYVGFFLEDRELFRILMNYMVHSDRANLPVELDKKIVKATNRNIDIVAQAFQYGIETGEYPASMNIFQNRNAIWALLNGIISLRLFVGNEEKREERIRSEVQYSIETYLRGLRSTLSPEAAGSHPG